MEEKELSSEAIASRGNRDDGNLRSTRNLEREVVIMLYTAKLYLPGLFQRKAFLILGLLLPFVDFTTDCINAGNG